MRASNERPNRRRGLTWLAAGCLGQTVVGLLYSTVLGAIGGVKTLDISKQLGNRPTQQTYTGPTGPLNILVMGSDTRQGQDSRLTGSGGNLSDTTILVHVFDGRTKAQGVSIQRDSMVEMPACVRDNGTVAPAGLRMFNQAYRIGGPACTVKTLESLTGLYIDHFVVVDFNGFIKVVDAVGGVPICLANPVYAPKAHLNLPAGNQVLSGFKALGWVRAREGVGDGSDLSRIKRQQLFMGSLVRTITSTKVLTNPVRLVDVLNAVANALTTDSGLGERNAMRDLALSLRKMKPSHVRFMSVPVRPYPENRNRLQWLPGKSAQLWAALKSDQPWPPAPTAEELAAKVTIAPSGVRLQVLNGTGVDGRATAVAAKLRALGYSVTKTAKAPATVNATTLSYGKGREDSVKTIAAATGLKPVYDASLGKAIVLTVGPNGVTATKVTVVKKPSPGELAQQGITADTEQCIATK